MKSVLHKASSRGHINFDWLDTYHTFSFGQYRNPERIHFGNLRVLNDDTVMGGMGFGMHPHDNMEIITIPLEGDLAHKDSMGNKAIIREGDVQVMSAGTGIQHSEFNHNTDRLVKLLQIWVFPREKNVKPRYDQISLKDVEKRNELYQILSPDAHDQGVWIHQDAWFFMGKLDVGHSLSHSIKKENNGVYLFVIEGRVKVEDQELEKRDGLGIWNTDQLTIKSLSDDAWVLLMDIPM